MNDRADPTHTDFELPADNLFGISTATAGRQIDRQDAIAEGHGTWSPFGASADLPEHNLFDSDMAADPVSDAPTSSVGIEPSHAWEHIDSSVGTGALPAWTPEPGSRSVRAARSRPTGTRQRACRVLVVGAGLLAVIVCLVIVALDLGGGAGAHRTPGARLAHRNTASVSRRPSSLRPTAPTANLSKRFSPSVPTHPHTTGSHSQRVRRRHRRHAVSHHRIVKRRSVITHARHSVAPVQRAASNQPISGQASSAAAPIATPQQPVVVAPQASPSPAAPASHSAPTPQEQEQEFGFEQ